MSTSIPEIPSLLPPPREIPMGVRMQVMNRQRLASSPMWTLPATSAFLFGAIAELPRGWHIAVVVFGASLLFMGLMRTLPVIRGSLRTIFRMQHGSAMLGQIVTCRFAIDGARDDRPYAEFLQKYPAIAGAATLTLGLGCMFGVFVLPMAFMFIVVILSFVVGGVVSIFKPHLVNMGNIDWQVFIGFCVGFIAMCLFTAGLLWIWRKGKVPMVEAYIRSEVAQRSPYTRERVREALAKAAEVGLGAPLPKRDETTNLPLACKVEYIAMGEMHKASATAILNDALNLAGFEPLLYHPQYPGEVDLFVGFPMSLGVTDGQWRTTKGFISGTSVVFAAGCALAATLLFVHQAFVLAAGR